MIPAEPFRAMIDGHGPVELHAVDFHPYEPSNYCTDPGWTCVSPDDSEFFVSETGDVYITLTTGAQGRIGSVAVLRGLSDAIDRELARMEGRYEARYFA